METFITVFRNPNIIDKIKSYLPICPKNSYHLPPTYFLRGAIIRYLTNDDFFLYVVFYFHMEKCLYYYPKKDILAILKNHTMINAVVENNDYYLLQRIYSFCGLSSYCINNSNMFTDENALFSAIKHDDIDMLTYLDTKMNTKYKQSDIHHYTNDLLNFAVINGNLRIVKYICFTYKIFSNERSTNTHNNILENALSDAIKYDSLSCAYFLIDYYKIRTNKINHLVVTTNVKDRIRTKAKIIHDKLFQSLQTLTHIRFHRFIEWWYIEYKINKIHDQEIYSHIETIKNQESISDIGKGYMMIKYLIQKSHHSNDLHYPIYVYLDDNTGYYTTKKEVFDEIIHHLYYKPLTVMYEKTADLYNDYYQLYQLLK